MIGTDDGVIKARSTRRRSKDVMWKGEAVLKMQGIPRCPVPGLNQGYHIPPEQMDATPDQPDTKTRYHDHNPSTIIHLHLLKPDDNGFTPRRFRNGWFRSLDSLKVARSVMICSREAMDGPLTKYTPLNADSEY